MNSKKIKPSMKIRKEIFEIVEGMKNGSPEYGKDPMRELMCKAKELIVQEMLEQEVTEHLGRESYERNEEKVYNFGQRNGYEPKGLKTPEGKLGLQIPQVRGGEEKYHSVLYDKLIPLLIESVKEQQIQIENQQNQINKLTEIVNGL